MSELDMDGDLLLKNVSNIRKRLLHTERNLQMLQIPRDNSRYPVPPEEDALGDEPLRPLTLDDLTDDDYSDHRPTDRRIGIRYNYQGELGAMQGVRHGGVSRPLREPRSNVTAPSSISSVQDIENESLRKKLQILRDENSQLVTSNHKLLNELESAGYELHSTRNQLKVVTRELESTKDEVPLLRSKLSQLESSIRLDGEALRSADKKLVEFEQELQENDAVLKQSREETKTVKSELSYEAQQRKRAENQRDEAMRSLEDITDQLNEYRNKTMEKFKQYQSSEDHLRDSLLHCDKEREELLEKATALEGELQDSRENIRSLKDESCRGLESATQDLQSTVSSLRDQLTHVQGGLDAKRRENTDLKDLTERQNERLAECQRDIEAGHSELERLEEIAHKLQEKVRHSADPSFLPTNSHNIPHPVRSSSPASDPGLISLSHHGLRNPSPAPSAMSADQAYDTGLGDDLDRFGPGAGGNKGLVAQLRMKLAMTEAENQRLQAARQRDTAGVSLSNSGTMDGLRFELSTLVEKNKIGDRKAQELTIIINRLEEERSRHAIQLTRLQERLTEQEAHSTAVESQLDHYNSQLQILNDEIECKGRRVAALQAEVAKKSTLIVHLEEHLAAKSTSIEGYTSQIAELEEQVQEKTSELQELQKSLDSKTEEADNINETLSKTKKLHTQQCREMEQQIEMLQESKEALSSQLQALNKSIDELQGELMSQMTHAKQLESELDMAQRDLEAKAHKHTQTTEALQLKVKDDAYRVSQLEAALLVCKEELTSYLTRQDDMKDRHNKEIQHRKNEAKKLEKQLRQAREEIQNKAAEIVELEQALKERQQMLLQSATRMAELEDKEGQLEHQVSHLEKGLSHITSAAEKDSALIEKKLHQACVDLEDRTSQLAEANDALSKAKSELAEANSRSADLELQLTKLKKDCDSHETKATQLDMDLGEVKSQLKDKTEKVSDLESSLETSRRENREHQARSQELDDELHKAQLELQTASKQLSDLQRLLQRSRAEAKQKQQRMQELSDELRRSQNEARSRDYDMAEMDDALKSSHRELQQRASQVNQLDMVVKEHQSESEQNILQLESSLTKSQYELKQCSRKIAELEDRCEEQQGNLKERALRVQQLEQLSSRQKNEISHKASEITQLQKRIEELTHQCSSHREDQLEQGQHLRLTREQMQRHHIELTEARRQLAQLQREKDQLAREYDDAVQLCRSKDDEHARLAEEHGAVIAREVETETRFGAELERIRDLQLQEMEEKEQELAQLQDSHAALLASKNQLEASHRLEISRLKDEETQTKKEIESLRQKVVDLENELLARKEVIQAGNEAIVIKEAEIARLNARISGYERATFGAQFMPPETSNSPSVATPGRTNLHHLLPPFAPYTSSPQIQSPRTSMRRSFSDHNISAATSTTLQNSVRDTHYSTNDLHNASDYHNYDTRRFVDTGYQSRGLLGSQDFREPPVTYVPNNRRDFYPVITKTHENSPQLGHFSDTDSIEDENFENFQGMLAFVNRHIANHELHEHNFASHVESHANNSNVSGVTTLEHQDSLLTERTRDDLDLTLDASDFQEGQGEQWKSPPKATRVITPSPRKHGNRSGDRQPLNDRSPGKKISQGHKPTIMKSPGQSRSLSPNSLPLKKRLVTQRAKMAASKAAAEGPLKPEDCMANLQDRLRANDERRRRIDDQLYNMRDHARKITNRILGKDVAENR